MRKELAKSELKKIIMVMLIVKKLKQMHAGGAPHAAGTPAQI